jgi:hypothetical protein
MAASQVWSSPKRWTIAVAYAGPSAQPSVPPVTHHDMARARFELVEPASAAVCGWNIATPTPPSTSSSTRAG